MITEFIVCILAGLGAGLGTGFAGMSAAAVISPMLITFLGMEPYQAIGIALASDVLASAISAYEYGKHKNLDIRNGLVLYRDDDAARHQIYRKAGHDDEGNDDGSRQKDPRDPVNSVRNRDRTDLWVCRGRRRHDDAAHSYLCTRL